MSSETINQSFDCGEEAYFSLSNIRGKVNIIPGDDHAITIQAEKILDTGDGENTFVELSQDSGGRVFARTRYGEPGFQIFRRMVPCKVNYQVSVPENCYLKVRGVSNAARIEGISGEIVISTVSGNLVLQSLQGELKIKTVSGDVTGEDVNAVIKLETVSGEIHFKKSILHRLGCKTVSGDLILEAPIGAGPYDFNAVSGDIEWKIDAFSGATITSSSLSGEVQTSLPVTASNHSRNHHIFEILGGGVEIHHKSVSGDFLLTYDGNRDGVDEFTVPDLNQPELVSNQEILEGIDRGEISVQEAVGLIERGHR
ncbi:MAG: DUF4097 family beta strand repeat-containing protein [Anaerolineales bacterium]